MDCSHINDINRTNVIACTYKSFFLFHYFGHIINDRICDDNDIKREICNAGNMQYFVQMLSKSSAKTFQEFLLLYL